MNVKTYYELLAPLCESLLDAQEKNLMKAAKVCAEAIEKGGVIHAFGSGHSHCLVEELFHRAGGLIPINPLLEPSLMPHIGPNQAGRSERLSGFAETFLPSYNFKKNEPVLIFSNSGINPVPIEVALYVKNLGCQVISVTSVEHSQNQKSRHPKGLKLYEVSDLVIDSGVPVGDAVVPIPNSSLKAIPASGFLGILVVNTLATLVVQSLIAKKIDPPIYQSANTAGGPERNQKLEEKYLPRIKCLN